VADHPPLSRSAAFTWCRVELLGTAARVDGTWGNPWPAGWPGLVRDLRG
jgi:hypothetical protein